MRELLSTDSLDVALRKALENAEEANGLDRPLASEMAVCSAIAEKLVRQLRTPVTQTASKAEVFASMSALMARSACVAVSATRVLKGTLKIIVDSIEERKQNDGGIEADH